MSSIVSCMKEEAHNTVRRDVEDSVMFSTCVCAFVTHQHYNVFHVVVLLGVKECCELLLIGFHVMVLVGHFEPPLITGHHLPVAESIIGVWVI